MILLITGGSGFIGSNFIYYWLNNYSNDLIINLDVLTYAGNNKSLEDVSKKYNSRYIFKKGNICDYETVSNIVDEYNIDTIINFAAESHNSYSIINPSAFYLTNLMGTQNLLEITRKKRIKHFHHISTCEVYGDLALNSIQKFHEDSPLIPNSPYSSSKAAADLAVFAYYSTYNIPVTVSRCSNNFGRFQFVEKLIPLFITNLLQNKPLTLYKESLNKREWLFVHDHCRAIDYIINKGELGQCYNIGSGIEKSIEEIADFLLNYFHKDFSYKKYINSRPSHDRRYLLDSSKIQNSLGWEPIYNFENALDITIKWYMNNRSWWFPLIGASPIDEMNWSN